MPGEGEKKREREIIKKERNRKRKTEMRVKSERGTKRERERERAKQSTDSFRVGGTQGWHRVVSEVMEAVEKVEGGSRRGKQSRKQGKLERERDGNSACALRPGGSSLPGWGWRVGLGRTLSTRLDEGWFRWVVGWQGLLPRIPS